MLTSVTLPTWLDKLIFQKLGAKFCCSKADMTVIDWDKEVNNFVAKSNNIWYNV